MNKERSNKKHEIGEKANLLGNRRLILDGPLGQRVKKHVGLTLNVAFDAHYTEMYLNMVYQKLPLHIKFNKYPMSITMGTDVIKYKYQLPATWTWCSD